MLKGVLRISGFLRCIHSLSVVLPAKGNCDRATAFWTDAVSRVIRPRGKWAPQPAPPKRVNSSAARAGDNLGPLPAPQVPRLPWTRPMRVSRRSPTLAVADAPKARENSAPRGLLYPFAWVASSGAGACRAHHEY